MSQLLFPAFVARTFRWVLLTAAIFAISQVAVIGQDTAALQREVDALKERVLDLEKQNAKLKSELDACLGTHAGAAGTNAVAGQAPITKPANRDNDSARPVALSGMYGGFVGAGTLKITFMDGQAVQVVSPGGETLSGTYKVEGATVFGELGPERLILQIIDNQTLRTTWEGAPVQLRKRR